MHYADAVKSNPQTSSTTKKEMEVEQRKWFGNARDRGVGSRKHLKSSHMVSAIEATATGEGQFANN